MHSIFMHFTGCHVFHFQTPNFNPYLRKTEWRWRGGASKIGSPPRHRHSVFLRQGLHLLMWNWEQFIGWGFVCGFANVPPICDLCLLWLCFAWLGLDLHGLARLASQLASQIASQIASQLIPKLPHKLPHISSNIASKCASQIASQIIPKLPHKLTGLGLACIGLACFGFALLDLAWTGMAWLGWLPNLLHKLHPKLLHKLTWLGLACIGLAWLGLACLGLGGIGLAGFPNCFANCIPNPFQHCIPNCFQTCLTNCIPNSCQNCFPNCSTIDSQIATQTAP